MPDARASGGGPSDRRLDRLDVINRRRKQAGAEPIRIAGTAPLQRVGALPSTSRIRQAIEHNRGLRQRLIADIEAAAGQAGLVQAPGRRAELLGSDAAAAAPRRRRAAQTQFPRGHRRGDRGGGWIGSPRRRTFTVLDSHEGRHMTTHCCRRGRKMLGFPNSTCAVCAPPDKSDAHLGAVERGQ